MSISINSNPSAKHHFAYRPVVWTVSSGDANIIRAIADVYINGTYEVTIEKSPDIGTTNSFTFDFQSVLQDFISHQAPSFTDSTASLYSSTSAVYYKARFFEVLDNSTTFDTSWAEDGAGTSFLDSIAVYNPAYGLNGTLRHEETQDLTVFDSGGTYAGLHRINKLTTVYDGLSVNKARKIKRGDFAIMSSWYNSVSAIQGRYRQYDSTDTLISATTTASLASATNVWEFAIDTSIMASNCKKFLMRHETTAPVAITNYSLFEIVEDCNDYVSLYWQNDTGGIDYYLFRDGQIKTYAGESSTYKQPLTTSFNAYDFGTTVYGKMGDIGISMVSEVVGRVEADALSNVITHAVRAWIYDGTNFVPVVITDGTMDTLNTEDGTYRLRVEVLHSNGLTVQRY